MREDRKWKYEMKKLFPAPPPREKEAFLRKLPDPALTAGGFLWHQAGYIQKWNWLLAAGLFLAAVLIGKGADAGERALRFLAAGMPFLALAAVAEGSRSVRFGMEELELSSRFSLKTVVMARLGILGLWDLLLLLGSIPLALTWGREQVWLSALYLLIPYLLTAFLNLAVVRRVCGGSSLYLCAGIAAFIGIRMMFVEPEKVWNMPGAGRWTPGVCAVLLAVLVGYEYLQIGKESEEYRWSLQ